MSGADDDDNHAGSNPVAADLRRLVLFFGDASDAAARIYAEVPNLPTQGRGHGTRVDRPAQNLPQLCGELVGPECRFAQTLSARIPFRDCGAGESLLAEAVVPDPCFWTPELPMMYRAKLGVREQGSGDRGQAVERLFGIRRLAALGRSLVLDQKRWVARAVHVEQVDADVLRQARDAGAVLCAASPDDEACLEASRQGVPLFADLTGATNLANEVQRLAQWPAVFVLLFDADAAIDASIRAVARNVLFAVTANQEIDPPPWAQVVFCEPGATKTIAGGDRELPIIVSRRAATSGIAAARAACDGLQYDIASLGDFAGYMV